MNCPIGFSGVGRFTRWQGSGPAPLPAPSPSLCPMWMQLTKWLRGAPLTSLKVPYRSSRKEVAGYCAQSVWNTQHCQHFFSDHGVCFGHSSSGWVWDATPLCCNNDRIDNDYQTVLRAKLVCWWVSILRDTAQRARNLVSAPLAPLCSEWHGIPFWEPLINRSQHRTECEENNTLASVPEYFCFPLCYLWLGDASRANVSLLLNWMVRYHLLGYSHGKYLRN